MKKIIIKIVVLSIIMVMLLFVEQIIDIRNNETIDLETVFVAAESIEVGTQLSRSMVKAVEIPKHLLSEYIIKDNFDGFLLTSVEAGEFLYTHQIASKSPLQIKASERLITIKCSIIESNGWAFQINDTVDIVMIDFDKSIVLKNALVSRIFDEDLSRDSMPAYLSVIVSEEDAMTYYKRVSNSRIFISSKTQEGL